MIGLLLALLEIALLAALASLVIGILRNLPGLFGILVDTRKQPSAATNAAKPPAENVRNRIAIALLLFAILFALPVVVVVTDK